MRHAEVGEPRDPRVVEEHVRRLDVAVEHAEPVRLAERGEERDGNLHRARRRQRLAQETFFERAARHPGQHQRRTFRHVVAQRHHVRMIERGQHPHLALEAGERVASSSARLVGGEDLHRHQLAPYRVGALDHTRAVGVEAISRIAS